jgi:hypothetical protein
MDALPQKLTDFSEKRFAKLILESFSEDQKEQPNQFAPNMKSFFQKNTQINNNYPCKFSAIQKYFCIVMDMEEIDNRVFRSYYSGEIN